MKLGSVCDVVRGSSPRPQGDPKYFGGNIPRLMIADITRDGKYVTPIIDSLTEEGAKKSRPMKKGDVIIAVSGDPGRPCILAVDACIHDGFVGLRNVDENKILKTYLFCFLNYFKVSNQKNAVGAIFQNLTTDQIKKIEIPEISINNQKKIVQILDQTEELLSQRKVSIILLDKLLQNIFLNMFGNLNNNDKKWEFNKLDHLVTKLGDGLHGTPVYSEDGKYFFINGNNLNNGKIIINNLTKRVSETEYLKHRKDLDNSTMLVSINGTIGKVAFYNGEKIILGKSACYFNLKKNKINPKFLYYIFQSEYFSNYVKIVSTGSTIQNLSLKSMREFLIPNPPMQLQNQFTTIVEKVEDLKKQYKVSLKELENMNGVLSQKAFKGELNLNKVDLELYNDELKTPFSVSLKQQIKVENLTVFPDKEKHINQTKSIEYEYFSNTDLENIIDSILNKYESELYFSINSIENEFNSLKIPFNRSFTINYLKRLLNENRIKQEYSGVTKQVMFKIKK